jgi:hypothetical protein
MIKLTIFLLTSLPSGTTDNFEQKACDYFFENVFNQEYKDYKVIEFQTQTDTSKYWGIVHQCENWDQTTRDKIISSTPGEMVFVKANTNIKLRKIRKNSGRLKVYVYSRVKVENTYFVSIATYRKLRFAEYYFIRFDKEGNVIEACKTGEII